MVFNFFYEPFFFRFGRLNRTMFKCTSKLSICLTFWKCFNLRKQWECIPTEPGEQAKRGAHKCAFALFDCFTPAIRVSLHTPLAMDVPLEPLPVTVTAYFQSQSPGSIFTRSCQSLTLDNYRKNLHPLLTLKILRATKIESERG